MHPSSGMPPKHEYAPCLRRSHFYRCGWPVCGGASLGFGGRLFRAQGSLNELAKRFPEDTIVQFNYLPTIRAQLALNRNDKPRLLRC